MAAPERIEWRRAFPGRELSALAWYAATATGAVAGVWLLFGDEPERLVDGAANPMAPLPEWSIVVALIGLGVSVHNLCRRPMVASSQYALTVRPGSRRTLVLPWAAVEHIAVAKIGDESFLLIRCRDDFGSLGSRPHWCDRTVLRALTRAGNQLATRFDLALRMNDFVGDPAARLAALAAFAPDHVVIAPHVSAA